MNLNAKPDVTCLPDVLDHARRDEVVHPQEVLETGLDRYKAPRGKNAFSFLLILTFVF